MEIPRMLREQIKFYERHGFHVTDIENRAGAHFRVTFAEFSKPQFISKNVNEPRGWKNNIARFRNLAKEQQENVKSV